MTNHSYKGLTQPLQTDMVNPRCAKHRVLGATTVTTVTAAAAAARTKTSTVVYQCDCSLNEYKMLAAFLMLMQIYQTNAQMYLYSNINLSE